MDRLDPDNIRPFLYEDDSTLSMHFDISAVQSRMRRDDPDALALDYTRVMMGWLLFGEPPTSILVIGLGGGSLVKYCRRTMPECRITVAEINSHVIALRDEFCIPRDDAKLRVVCADGAAVVATRDQSYDVILVDGFTWEGQAASLCTPSFYADCRASLSARGLFVANLHDEGTAGDVLTDRIAGTFDGAALHVSAADGSNRVVLACATPGILARTPRSLQRRFNALPATHQRALRDILARFKRAVGRTEDCKRLGTPS